MGWGFASTGDEIWERATRTAHEAFPKEMGFLHHHVMLATIDDRTVKQLIEVKSQTHP
jgi:hypothetical protein